MRFSVIHRFFFYILRFESDMCVWLFVWVHECDVQMCMYVSMHLCMCLYVHLCLCVCFCVHMYCIQGVLIPNIIAAHCLTSYPCHLRGTTASPALERRPRAQSSAVPDLTVSFWPCISCCVYLICVS